MVDADSPSLLASQEVGCRVLVVMGSSVVTKPVFTGLFRQKGGRDSTNYAPHIISEGKPLLDLASSTPATTIIFMRSEMFNNPLPVVVDALWPDHIEIELRIEIDR